MNCIKKYTVALSVIAAVFGMMGCKPEVHVHTFETGWTTDTEYHWHKAKCEHTEEVSDKLLHSYGEWNVTKEATEDTAGSKERECTVCGYKDIDIIPKKSHVHSSATTWIRTPATHEEKYDCCGAEKTEQSVHTWNHTDYQYDSTSKKDCRTCTVCGYVDEKDHVHGSATTWTITSATHKEIYNCCGAVKTAEAEHTEDDGTIDPPTCMRNGIKTYKCSVCGGNKRVEEYVSALGWCETAIDAQTYKKATSSSTYVYFGTFPKTVKDPAVKVNESDTKTMGPATYYKGNDNEWYAKVTANPYNASYTYSDGTTISKTDTFFKVEPIKWKVITTDYNGTKNALLLAEDILTANIPYYVNNGSERRANGNAIYDHNYVYSSIRAYLNGKYESKDTQSKTAYTDKGFLQTAFTASAQSLIAETTVDNSSDSTTDAGNNLSKGIDADNTTDKIFFLSEKEVTTTDYGFDGYKKYGKGNARIRVATDYAKANYAYQKTTDGYGGWWWLRSPGYWGNTSVYIIGDDGSADLSTDSDKASCGIVPALTMSF